MTCEYRLFINSRLVRFDPTKKWNFYRGLLVGQTFCDFYSQDSIIVPGKLRQKLLFLTLSLTAIIFEALSRWNLSQENKFLAFAQRAKQFFSFSFSFWLFYKAIRKNFLDAVSPRERWIAPVGKYVGGKISGVCAREHESAKRISDKRVIIDPDPAPDVCGATSGHVNLSSTTSTWSTLTLLIFSWKGMLVDRDMGFSVCNPRQGVEAIYLFTGFPSGIFQAKKYNFPFSSESTPRKYAQKKKKKYRKLQNFRFFFASRKKTFKFFFLSKLERRISFRVNRRLKKMIFIIHDDILDKNTFM